MTTYSGFSTVNRIKKFRVTDFDLVKQDLNNHFNIRKGEKLMNPEFGTIIWDTLFEPLNEETKAVIINDIKRIVSYDPRIAAKNVTVTQYDQGLRIDLDLIYISTNQSSRLAIQFDQNAKNTRTL